MHDDFHPYYVRVGDAWTKIDYGKPAEEWMKPLVRGEETDLVEIPASWYLDDLPPMMFIKKARTATASSTRGTSSRSGSTSSTGSTASTTTRVFTMTIHPDVSGRPQVLLITSGSSSTSTATTACAG